MGVPIQFPEANTVWRGQGDVADAPAYRTIDRYGQYADRPDISITCWQLTDDEVEEIRRTGVAWLHVWGHHPPVHVGGHCPFDVVEADGDAPVAA